MRHHDVRANWRAKTAVWKFTTVVFVLLAGCTSTEPLNIKDSAAVDVHARAVWRLTPAPRGGLEIEASRVRASSNQQLQAIETVALGGQTLTGPMTLHNKGTLSYAHFGYNHLLFPTRPVEMEWFAGIAGLRIDWTTTPVSPPQAALSQRISTWGGMAGVAGRWKINAAVAIEARGSVMATVLGSPDWDGNRERAEIAFLFSPVPELRLRLGYAESSARLTSQDQGIASSEVSFKTRGPIVGLTFEWR